MTEFELKHGLSQDEPGPLEPVEIAQQDDTLARTGNTARDQEMYAAGIRTGEENAKHNAAIRSGAAPGVSTVEDAHPDDIAVDRFAAAMKAKLAKKRAQGRGGWSDKAQCTEAFLSELLRGHVEKGDPVDVGNLAMMLHQRGEAIAPAAGDALDAARYRWLRVEANKVEQFGSFSPYVIQGQTANLLSGESLDACVDAAIAAQVPHKGDAA